MIQNCPPDKIFWLQDGRTLKNIYELANALQTMNNTTFSHHTHSGNDFANWIEHVFGKKELADKIKTAKNRKEMAKIVLGTTLPKKTQEKSKEMHTIAKKKITPIVAAKMPAKKPNAKKAKRKASKKKIAKAKRKTPVLDEKYRMLPETTHPHIALATHVALGIVVGSAITILILMLL